MSVAAVAAPVVANVVVAATVVPLVAAEVDAAAFAAAVAAAVAAAAAFVVVVVAVAAPAVFVAAAVSVPAVVASVVAAAFHPASVVSVADFCPFLVTCYHSLGPIGAWLNLSGFNTSTNVMACWVGSIGFLPGHAFDKWPTAPQDQHWG